MTDMQALKVLLDQNERLRDKTRADHQKAQSASDAALEQAEQLRNYRLEYERRWSAQFCQDGKIELVRCYHSFMARLTQAVDQQAHAAEQAGRRVEHALAAVREAELRCASVRKLMERRVHEHRIATDRRDQKQTDEFAARAAWGASGRGRPRDF